MTPVRGPGRARHPDPAARRRRDARRVRRRRCWSPTRCRSCGRGFDDGRQTARAARRRGLICLLGVADDKWELDALTKLAGQVLAAGVMVLLGVQLQMLYLPIGGIGRRSSFGRNDVVLGPVDGTVLIVLVVVTVNAVNFVDGLDGLAAGHRRRSPPLAFFVFSYLLPVTATS